MLAERRFLLYYDCSISIEIESLEKQCFWIKIKYSLCSTRTGSVSSRGIMTLNRLRKSYKGFKEIEEKKIE